MPKRFNACAVVVRTPGGSRPPPQRDEQVLAGCVWRQGLRLAPVRLVEGRACRARARRAVGDQDGDGFAEIARYLNSRPHRQPRRSKKGWTRHGGRRRQQRRTAAEQDRQGVRFVTVEIAGQSAQFDTSDRPNNQNGGQSRLGLAVHYSGKAARNQWESL
jgi:hypothetical protein